MTTRDPGPDRTYWASNGKHQADYERLWEALVPAEGRARTMPGELLRSMSRLYHDVYNNGGCNMDTPHMQGFAHFVRGFAEDLAQTRECDHEDVVTTMRRLREAGEDEGIEVLEEPTFLSALERCMDAVVAWARHETEETPSA